MTTITLDPILEKKLQKRAKEMNMPLQIVITSQLEHFADYGDETASPAVLAELRQVEEDARSGKVNGPFSNTKELFAHLHSL